MTADSDRPTQRPRRRARLRPEHHRGYPLNYIGQWFRVVERHDPDIPISPGDIWLALPGGIQRMQAAQWDIEERTKPLILLVDDDAGIRGSLQVALSKAGYDILLAGDGEEGTRLWHEAGPDLIITDIHMPKKSGLLLIEDLQAQGSSTPIIAMTDGGPAENFSLLHIAELLGPVRTVPKPFSLSDMLEAVSQELS